MNISKKVLQKLTMLMLVGMAFTVLLPLTANAYFAVHFNYNSTNQEVSGQVYTKDWNKVHVKITADDHSVTELRYSDGTSLSEFFYGYDDNNNIYKSLGFSKLNIASAPSSIQVSNDNGQNWLFTEKNENNYNGFFDDENVKLNGYRISATESYSSISESTATYVSPNTELFRFTPANDTLNNISHTDNLIALSFDFGADNLLNWSKLTGSDFVLKNTTNNSVISISGIRPAKDNQYNPYTATWTSKDSTRELIIETQTKLLLGNNYALVTSSLMDGNEIKRLSAGKYDLSLSIGSIVNNFDTDLNADTYYVKADNYHAFNQVTVVNQVPPTGPSTGGTPTVPEIVTDPPVIDSNASEVLSSGFYYYSSNQKLGGNIYTKDPNKLRVKITAKNNSITEVTSSSAQFFGTVYDDNNIMYKNVVFNGIPVAEAPLSIQVSENDGIDWISFTSTDNNFTYRNQNEKVRLGAYRISATQKYSSVSANTYVPANTELFRFTPADDTVNNILHTHNLNSIKIDFGADNSLNWGNITISDIILMDVTDNNRIIGLAGFTSERNNTFPDWVNPNLTRTMVIETQSYLVRNHEYVIKTSDSAQGNEIKLPPAGQYNLSLYVGLLFNNVVTVQATTNLHKFDNVTISDPTPPTPSTPPTGSFSFPATPPAVTTGSNGVTLTLGPDSVKTETNSDGKQNVTLSLNNDDLKNAFEALKNNQSASQTIIVNVDKKGDSTKVELPAGLLAESIKSSPETVISVKTDSGSFDLPIQSIDFEALAKKLGTDIAKLKLSISLNAPTSEQEKSVRLKAEAQGLSIINVLDFSVTAEAGGKTEEITSFGSTYVPRTIAITGQTDIKKLMAVIINSESGELQFIPAIQKNSNEIVIMAPHASLYAIAERKDKSFSDIQKHWAKSDIELLASRLLVNGTSADNFSPDKDVTRAEFTTLIARALGLEMVKTGTKFTDVSAKSYYAKAVEAAVLAGIVQGRSDTLFAPNATITREEMYVMVARAVAFAGKKIEISGKQKQLLDTFTDNSRISSWAQAAVAQSAEANIIRREANTQLKPQANATRADAVSSLKRLLEYVKFIN
ncbi:S-layer homology domain-containing protein [Cohnella abietis]|uniref:SLH domain-containing protein n=1 Tax=Cohnella abietis TaxID=2507935 RepID=A0A3T1DA47_9BACL|nr:S-layer homology domain-containing protein [Cohnella abietis]BBI34939.1 hypothetical protein KCTCHS21_43380 [Cohnella abietis]